MPKRFKQHIKDLLESIFGVEIKNRQRKVPGMISTEERHFLMECSLRMSGKPGAIVDLGTWLGASAASLAEGVKKGAPSRQAQSHDIIYSIDQFRWEDSMNVGYLNHGAHLEYKPGESFLPETRTYLRDYNGLIQLIESDLAQYDWDKGAIKILHVDAMKSADVSQKIARSFFPSLRKESILIYQDFKHWYTPWIHLIHYRLKDHFSVMHEVKTGGTVAFETSGDLSRETVTKASEFDGFDEQEVQKAFEHSFSITSEDARPKIAAAHVMYFVHEKLEREAEELFRMYLEKGYASEPDMLKTKEYMDGKFADD